MTTNITVGMWANEIIDRARAAGATADLDYLADDDAAVTIGTSGGVAGVAFRNDSQSGKTVIRLALQRETDPLTVLEAAVGALVAPAGKAIPA